MMHKLTKPAIRILAAVLVLLFGSSHVTADAGVQLDNPLGDMLEGVPAGLILENQNLPYIFWVELRAGSLHLLERTKEGNYLKRVSTSISIGKEGFGKQVEGDRKTPVGIYQITSFLKDEQLDDYYGIGAYPLNYPNIWDRLSGRTGHGIWFHGLPKGTETRPLLDSEGCVITDNLTLQKFADFIETGESLFVLSESLDWLEPGTMQPSADILEAIESWRADWQNNNISEYLANYHLNFTDSRRNLKEWKTYKTRVNGLKTYIRIILSKMSVIAYPGEENLVAMRFYQHYESSNFNWRGWKHLLWRRDDAGVWRILYEGNG
jgi:murein L,D-transpeptidase YafK